MLVKAYRSSSPPGPSSSSDSSTCIEHTNEHEETFHMLLVTTQGSCALLLGSIYSTDRPSSTLRHEVPGPHYDFGTLYTKPDLGRFGKGSQAWCMQHRMHAYRDIYARYRDRAQHRNNTFLGIRSPLRAAALCCRLACICCRCRMRACRAACLFCLLAHSFSALAMSLPGCITHRMS